MASWSVALSAGDWIEQELNAGLVSKTGIFNIDIHRASGCILLVGLWQRVRTYPLPKCVFGRKCPGSKGRTFCTSALDATRLTNEHLRVRRRSQNFASTLTYSLRPTFRSCTGACSLSAPSIISLPTGSSSKLHLCLGGLFATRSIPHQPQTPNGRNGARFPLTCALSLRLWCRRV